MYPQRPPKLLSRLQCIAASLLLGGALTCHAQTSDLADIDQAEVLGWSDPGRATQLLDQAESRNATGARLEEIWVVRGQIAVDTRKDDATATAVARLLQMGAHSPSARLDARVLQIYLLCQQDQYDRAALELKSIDSNIPHSTLAGYRLESLRGTVLGFLGRHEAALLAIERALDIARSMPSLPREVDAQVRMSRLWMATGNLAAAQAALSEARQLAAKSEDEAALTRISRSEADLADRQGDRAAERRASLEALAHARHSGSTVLLALAYADLGDSYVKTAEFAKSSDYSRRALALAPSIQRSDFEPTVRFNLGLAEIGVGDIARGKALAQEAVQHVLDSGNLVDADGMFHEFGQALERAGDLAGAVRTFHQNEALRDRLLTSAREKALLELSEKFAAERRAREIELLKRDNALKDHDLLAQRRNQHTIVGATLLISLACAALVWTIGRIRKVNARLRFQSQHDALTGLRNRRFFNETVLADTANKPFEGCVLLIDVDHFKRINDTYGHPVGDSVLKVLGQRMSGVLRGSDLLVRWGGEEFLALLGPQSDAQLNATAHRLLNVVRDGLSCDGHMIKCTVSIGCTRLPMAGPAVDVPLERAIALVDKALYQAKHRGRNRACLITLVNANSEQELAHINEHFDEASAQRRVLVLETISAAA
jgi:diguanylate cyclase (GGDEF)-like protein